MKTSPGTNCKLQNLSDLEFNLSRSLKVKRDDAVRLPIMICNSSWCLISNTWPESAPLRDISLPHLSDLDIDLSRSLKSHVITSMDSPYICCKCLIVTHGLTLLLCEIYKALTFNHSRSNMIVSLDFPYVVSYY